MGFQTCNRVNQVVHRIQPPITISLPPSNSCSRARARGGKTRVNLSILSTVLALLDAPSAGHELTLLEDASILGVQLIPPCTPLAGLSRKDYSSASS